jgi:glutathione S-transferase
MRLVIANKLYSSWSLRPWLVAAHFGIPFEEIVIPLDQPDTHARILEHSPSGRVPCLIDGDLHVWESLAIIEYLAEAFPDHAIWPRDREARALARSISNEMHAGFQGLRKACPMNLRRDFAWRDFGREASENAVRIVELWRDARRRHGAAGPFLFGAFSAADAFFAPVCMRISRYALPVSAATQAYIQRVSAAPGVARFIDDALAEQDFLDFEEPYRTSRD